MDMFEKSKPCTIEPRNKSEMKSAMEKYYGDVKTDKGGALFAVCRGKVGKLKKRLNIFFHCLVQATVAFRMLAYPF